MGLKVFLYVFGARDVHACLRVTLPCECTGDTKLYLAPLWPAGPAI